MSSCSAPWADVPRYDGEAQSVPAIDAHARRRHLAKQRHFLNLTRFVINELSLPTSAPGRRKHIALLVDQHLADRFDAIELVAWRNAKSFALLLRSLASTRPRPEDKPVILPLAPAKAAEMNRRRLTRAVEEYGSVRAERLLAHMLKQPKSLRAASRA